MLAPYAKVIGLNILIFLGLALIIQTSVDAIPLPTQPAVDLTDTQALLKARISATKGKTLMSGNRLQANQWKYHSLRPMWWKNIFDMTTVELDCHNRDAEHEGVGVNFQHRQTGEARFDQLGNLDNSSAVLVIVQCDICQLLRGWKKFASSVQGKFVLLGDMSQDRSVLSENWPGVISNWWDVKSSTSICGMSTKTITDFLHDDRLVLWLSGQQSFLAHPKILSLPLGMFHPQWMEKSMEHFLAEPRKYYVADTSNTRTGKRNDIAKMLTKELPAGTVAKTPPLPKDYNTIEVGLHHNPCVKTCTLPKNHFTWYWNFTGHSQFVLSPPGTGFDCYRHWEAITMGAIPIILHSTFDRSFAGLPVLLVDDYKNVTKPLLEQTLLHYHKNAAIWKFERLTVEYWHNLIAQVLKTGSAELVQANHPIEKKYFGDFIPKDSWDNVQGH